MCFVVVVVFWCCLMWSLVSVKCCCCFLVLFHVVTGQCEMIYHFFQAKKRQAYLEESYGTAFKELEFLVMNYDPDEKAKKTSMFFSVCFRFSL